ncbi:hypothetical protein [Pandoraea sputorum]|uniref:hypothetical protein n=1 Tax=Pandoraea sputorum TaxID=93222 RepID=UPI001242C7DB|nr:hypothetical protein [Pandoraea sputorum]VVE54634.1 hypothetical protein PSP20601_04924 [Pandoraea sputorum]
MHNGYAIDAAASISETERIKKIAAPPVEPTEPQTCDAPEPTDEVYACLANRFFDTERAAEDLTITTFAQDGAILIDRETLAKNHALTPVACGKAGFEHIVERVASALQRSGADKGDVRKAAHVLAILMGTREFAELPRHAAEYATNIFSTGSPQSATHMTLTSEGKVRVRHDVWWTPPVDASPPADGVLTDNKSDPRGLHTRLESIFWLEPKRGAETSAQADAAQPFALHVQVEHSRLTPPNGPLGEDLVEKFKSAPSHFDEHVRHRLANVCGKAGLHIVAPIMAGGPPAEGSDTKRVVVGAANWLPLLQINKEQACEPEFPPSGGVGVAEHPAPPSHQGSAPPPRGGVQEEGGLSFSLLPVSLRASLHGPVAAPASASKPVPSSARGWWTPTLYGSWLAVAAAYLSGTVAQFFEKVRTLGAAATMSIYPVMQGGAIAEVITVWWLSRQQAAEQKKRNEELGKVEKAADEFGKIHAQFKRQENERKRHAAEQNARAARREALEVDVVGDGQADAAIQGSDEKAARPDPDQAAAALKKKELTALSAVASLPARANRVWYVRDVYVQAGATVVRLLNWAGTKFGFLISPLLGAFTGVFGAIGGVLHIAQGTIEHTRAAQDAQTLADFKAKVLGITSEGLAASSEATGSLENLKALDERLLVDKKNGSAGKASFRELLQVSDEQSLLVASKLANVVHAKLLKNAEHSIEVADKQRLNAKIRIGVGVGTTTLSLLLGGFAYLGIGGVAALAATTAVVTLAVFWLGFAVVEWVRAGREKKQVTAPSLQDVEKIKGWANEKLSELERQFREDGGAESDKFFIAALMARYLALSKNPDAQTKFSSELDAQAKLSSELDAQAKLSSELDAQAKLSSELDAQAELLSGLDAQAKSSSELDAQEPVDRSVPRSKLRVRVTKRLLMQGAIDGFSELRDMSEAAVRNPDKYEQKFVDVVTSITLHIEGKRGLERRLAAAANYVTEPHAA